PRRRSACDDPGTYRCGARYLLGPFTTGAAAVLLAVLLRRGGEPNPRAHFDTVGALLSTVAFGSVLYGLSRVGADGWDSLTVRGLIGVGLVTLVVFLAFETTQEHPLLDVRLFGNGQFLIANVV